MKHSAQKPICLLLFCIALAQPFAARSRNPSTDKKDSPAVQTSETIKWKFGGADAGTTTYQTHPDGKFESVTELRLAGMTMKSSLTGRLVEIGRAHV